MFAADHASDWQSCREGAEAMIVGGQARSSSCGLAASAVAHSESLKQVAAVIGRRHPSGESIDRPCRARASRGVY